MNTARPENHGSWQMGAWAIPDKPDPAEPLTVGNLAAPHVGVAAMVDMGEDLTVGYAASGIRRHEIPHVVGP